VLRESIRELIAGQVADPAAGALYLLASETIRPARGPWVLCRISLRTGAVRLGPTFPVGSLAEASGYLWVYSAPGPGSQPAISQVNPATLAVVRPIALPRVPANLTGLPAVVAAGADGSVWLGTGRALMRVGVSTGVTLTRVILPAGLAVWDVTANPAGTALYVAAARVMSGETAGLVMLEYDARSGRRLAMMPGGPLRYSAGGAGLTAVPGGVWVSFRTGMMGLTVHLGAHGLRMIAPPGPGIAKTPPTGVFHWPMDEAIVYGGGALWVATLRFMACLNPRTGKVRASERVGQSPQATNHLIYQFQAVDPKEHAIYGVSVDGLLHVTPPRRCWG
jgi:hypothetical protein